MLEIGDDETLDEIRGIRIIQKRKGYRFSIDSVLLSDFPDLSGVKRAADLGTGSGIIAILLAMRSKNLNVVGIELQRSLFDMAVRNVAMASLSERVNILHGDLKKTNEIFDKAGFDLVVSNPPYFPLGKGRIGPNQERTVARHEVAVNVTDIIKTAEYILNDGGRVAMVYPAWRIRELVSMMKGHGLGPFRLKEVHTKEAELALIEGKKGYDGELLEEAPLLL